MFDPTLPANGSPNSSAEMRGQFQGLKALIDAIQQITAAQVDGVNTVNPGDPAGVTVSIIGTVLHLSFAIPRGNDGTAGSNGTDGGQGPPFTNFVVDGVTTLNPGDNASVQASFDGSAVRLTFGIPRGNDGNPGSNGNDGGPGPQGPPFANAIVDGVNTLNPGDAATVQSSFDGSNVHFTFGIPRGFNGSDGGTGGQGPPGEVTNAQLASAINGTSNNTNGVGTMGQSADGSYQQWQMQLLFDKLDELINALRR